MSQILIYKTMKRYLSILTFMTIPFFACCIGFSASAKKNLVVKYLVTNRDTDSGQPVTEDMVLIANPSESLYFNTMSLYCDSCNSTPEGKAKLREIQLKAWRVIHPDGSVTYDGRKLGLAPDKSEYLYVAKDLKRQKLSVYDYKGEGLFKYEEPATEMVWKIEEDSTKTILGYDCVMAKTDYHGRTWTVWFAPDIPVQDGPWKLHGLPGVILQADGGDGFNIEASETGSTGRDVPKVYSVNEYEKGERRKILADHEYYINNLESIMAAQGIMLNGDGSPANLPKYDRQRQAWETDY